MGGPDPSRAAAPRRGRRGQRQRARVQRNGCHREKRSLLTSRSRRTPFLARRARFSLFLVFGVPGGFRADDGKASNSCGATGHRVYAPPPSRQSHDRKTVTHVGGTRMKPNVVKFGGHFGLLSDGMGKVQPAGFAARCSFCNVHFIGGHTLLQYLEMCPHIGNFISPS